MISFNLRTKQQIQSISSFGHGIDMNLKSNSMSAPLKFMLPDAFDHRHPTPSIRHSVKFSRQVLAKGFFRIQVQNVSKTSAFVTGKFKKCPGSLTTMASKWRIDGLLSDIHIEKKGTSFHESWFCWDCEKEQRQKFLTASLDRVLPWVRFLVGKAGFFPSTIANAICESYSLLKVFVLQGCAVIY